MMEVVPEESLSDAPKGSWTDQTWTGMSAQYKIFLNHLLLPLDLPFDAPQTLKMSGSSLANSGGLQNTKPTRANAARDCRKCVPLNVDRKL
jgi:hypothetical protein